MPSDLYRIDNLLLRVGIALAVLVAVIALAFRPWEGRDPRPLEGAYLVTVIDADGRMVEIRDYVWEGISSERERIEHLEQRHPDAIHIRPMPRTLFNFSPQERYFIAAGLGPLAMVALGAWIRRREKRLLSIWKLLHRNVETDVGDLLRNSDFSRKQIEATVRTLNKRGLAFYAWRRDTDTIEDGRLGSAMLHIERCDSCGASVGLSVPASLREVPTCHYCGSAQSARHLNQLKREVIRDLRDQPVSSNVPAAAHKPMSIGLFIVLILLCWPAAIAYAVYKSSSAQRLV